MSVNLAIASGISDEQMKTRLDKIMLSALAAVLLALSAPSAAFAQSLEEAAQQAARQYNAKVLSARTVNEGNRRVHVIKLLTKDGVVKVVRIPVRG
ncbi:MAG TPA: hypothetical protein VJ984_11320 [Xanthomonadales bacterium]|nr:hypothetical protein [Xanthomonadales bacterium]